MGFMDKVKESVKSADEKLGNAIDSSKIDSKIRDEERKIEELTKEMGEKVLANFRDGAALAEDDLKAVYAKIQDCEKTIEDLKAEKEALKSEKKEE
ncbi:MAG: hypothetical protein IJ026_00290 [Candidatus Methanomethylophilaceae archaeon]|nr:hypothetical protein [Candidatus Methanomethylophilaceae archaeon]